MEDKHTKINEYLSIKGASELLGVTPNTLRNWETRGFIKVSRQPFSNYRLYLKEDLIEILNSIAMSKGKNGK